MAKYKLLYKIGIYTYTAKEMKEKGMEKPKKGKQLPIIISFEKPK